MLETLLLGGWCIGWLYWFFVCYYVFLICLGLYGLWCGCDALRIIGAARLELQVRKDKLSDGNS